jgi:hypothetical protein
VKTSRGTRLVAVFLLALAATGCGHALSQPMPDMKGRLALKVVREQPSKMNDMPMGVHQIPDTSVYVSGHQGAAGVGVLFGVIGLAVAHAAAQSTGESKTKDAQAALRVDIAAETERVLAEEMARLPESPRFATAGTPADGALELAPFIVVNFIGENQVRPWVVLMTRLKDGRGDEKWKTRYIASLAEPRPLTGDNGWASDDGALLRKALEDSLRAAIGVFLKDAGGTLRPGTPRAVKVKGQWVWVKQPLEMPAKVLEETDETIVVVPDVSDAIVFAGVNVLGKKWIVVTDDRSAEESKPAFAPNDRRRTAPR